MKKFILSATALTTIVFGATAASAADMPKYAAGDTKFEILAAKAKSSGCQVYGEVTVTTRDVAGRYQDSTTSQIGGDQGCALGADFILGRGVGEIVQFPANVASDESAPDSVQRIVISPAELLDPKSAGWKPLDGGSYKTLPKGTSAFVQLPARPQSPMTKADFEALKMISGSTSGNDAAAVGTVTVMGDGGSCVRYDAVYLGGYLDATISRYSDSDACASLIKPNPIAQVSAWQVSTLGDADVYPAERIKGLTFSNDGRRLREGDGEVRFIPAGK